MSTDTWIRIGAFAVLALLIVLAWRGRGKPRAPEDDQGATPRGLEGNDQ